MLSQRTRYTIRALQHLARRYGQGPIHLADIAETQNIPGKFLTVILSELSREGLIATQRGRDGGYWLALPPMDIRYGDILRMTNGALALVPCASRFAHEPCKNCLPEEKCELRRIMLLVRDETAAILDRLTLADRFDVGDDEKEGSPA
ncbi:Rrf2 family transcriptional regulator [soil metagenome]